ncbi:hypothetical protein [Vagococcus fluvialis]|jgi:transcription elongation factor|uniref:hypothetical protein n=1 Tax=Vagococcus fluvialis TaxID=2738 RepID=UPI001A90B269|nr:hypothetical protein [Vagococcus fluvialis]MBO0486926.1 hypothetical protein [Vagococcus fluvialis]MCM2138362.1 hypothetical protein [Vagococcus fluvialis]UDM80533.1 hypothetical protein K5K97_04190 [Vagococcus fluvialis]
MEVLLGSQVRIQFLNKELETVRGTVLNVFKDSLRVEVESTNKHVIVVKTAISVIEILD